MDVPVTYLPYLPNVAWFKAVLPAGHVCVEQHENFVKSTYRNRCDIAGPNGLQVLSIPLTGGRDHRQLYRQALIDYTQPWQSHHWHSIRTAYGRSPFFEHYSFKLEPFYQTQYHRLFDFNYALLKTIYSCLKLGEVPPLTTAYQKTGPGKIDLRLTGKINTAVTMPRYYRIFEEKTGFIPNLSIIDLLFHLGPEALSYLQQK